jgi:hypothetical protein
MKTQSLSISLGDDQTNQMTLVFDGYTLPTLQIQVITEAAHEKRY